MKHNVLHLECFCTVYVWQCNVYVHHDSLQCYNVLHLVSILERYIIIIITGLWLFTQISWFYTSLPFASKCSWKQRSSHQGKKEVYCIISGLFHIKLSIWPKGQKRFNVQRNYDITLKFTPNYIKHTIKGYKKILKINIQIAQINKG